MEEDKRSSSSYFLTLTYSDENLPISDHGELTLNKRDIQLFMKRLRKDNEKKLKYYACGEYGGKTKRPHYHMILFNAEESTIENNWGLGHIHYGKVNEASVGYTLKYMMKWKKKQSDLKEKEFSLMSKGLGISYLTKAMTQWHLNDLENRTYCNLKDGKKIAMPRYYRDKIYNQEQRGILKSHFTEKAQKELIELAYNPEINKILESRKKSIKNEFQKMLRAEKSRSN